VQRICTSDVGGVPEAGRARGIPATRASPPAGARHLHHTCTERAPAPGTVLRSRTTTTTITALTRSTTMTATATLLSPTDNPDATPATTRRLARLAGLLYLVVLVTGAPPELLVRGPIAAEQGATAVATAIREGADLFRLAAFSDLLNIVAFLGVALVLYGLLRRVHAGAARAMLVFNAVSVAIMALNTVNHVAAWWFATQDGIRASLGAATADGLAATFLELHGIGFNVAEIFFGLWLFPLGWMLWRTRAVPRPIAGLLMAGTVGYLANVTATFVSPTLSHELVGLFTTPSALAEVSLLAWLLVKGLALPHDDAPVVG
jgi:hypothetical protein